MNFAKLNHILIPARKDERDALRTSKRGRILWLMFGVFFLLSDEGRVAILFWLVASGLSINVQLNQYYVFWGGLLGVLVASVALRHTVALKGLKLKVRAPRRVTVGDEVTFTLSLRNEGERVHQAIRLEGPFLPWDGRYTSQRPSVPRLDPQAAVERVMTARFVARGEHYLDAFEARSLAPLGLATSPPVASEGTRFLVVPRIASVVHVTTQAAKRYQPGGIPLASVLGESRELVGVRPYRPGDPIRDLHARTSARLGVPVVREYQQEYFTRIGIVLDTDGGEADDPVFEASVSLAAGVIARLSRGEALIDLLVVDEEAHRLTLGRSLGFLEQALDLLACARPKQGFVPARLQALLAEHLPRLSSIIYISLIRDAERLLVCEWIERHGVGCRLLQVAPWSKSQPRGAPCDIVWAADILKGKELVL